MLKAIEEEHFDQLPGGVFNKGSIRAYARHLGLDGEEAVNEYLAWLRQAQVDANTVPGPQRVQERRVPAITPAAVAPPPVPKIVTADVKSEAKAPAVFLAVPPAPAITQPAAKIDSQPNLAASPPAPVRIDPADSEPEPPKFQPPARDEVELPDLQLPNAEHIRQRMRPAGQSRSGIPWGIPVAPVPLILFVTMLCNWH